MEGTLTVCSACLYGLFACMYVDRAFTTQSAFICLYVCWQCFYHQSANYHVHMIFPLQSTLTRGGGTSLTISGYNTMNGSLSPGSLHNLSFEGSLESSLANSPPVPSKEAFQYLFRPKNFAERARINCAYVGSLMCRLENVGGRGEVGRGLGGGEGVSVRVRVCTYCLCVAGCDRLCV